MSDPYLVPESRIKRAGAVRVYTVDFKDWVRSYWIARRAYNSGDIVRAPSISGFAFQANSTGEAGAQEPPWPRTLGATASDGSISWTAITPVLNALDPISSVIWSQVSPPDGTLVISSPVNTNEEASATFSAGTQGSTYRIQCSPTTVGGKVYPVQFDLEIA